MTDDWIEAVRTLLEAPSAAVLTTYRQDGSPLVSPVWFQLADSALEVVVAKGDVKLRHLARDPRCSLLIFETVRPFRGIEVHGVPEMVDEDMTVARTAIAGRYLGAEAGKRFAQERRARAGVLLRLRVVNPRVWSLADILPD